MFEVKKNHFLVGILRRFLGFRDRGDVRGNNKKRIIKFGQLLITFWLVFLFETATLHIFLLKIQIGRPPPQGRHPPLTGNHPLLR